MFTTYLTGSHENCLQTEIVMVEQAGICICLIRKAREHCGSHCLSQTPDQDVPADFCQRDMSAIILVEINS